MEDGRWKMMMNGINSNGKSSGTSLTMHWKVEEWGWRMGSGGIYPQFLKIALYIPWA